MLVSRSFWTSGHATFVTEIASQPAVLRQTPTIRIGSRSLSWDPGGAGVGRVSTLKRIVLPPWVQRIVTLRLVLSVRAHE